MIPSFVLSFAVLIPVAIIAYIGPGTGLSAIGAFLAFIFAIFAALLGFIWYPIKRIFGKTNREPKEPGTDNQ